MNTKKENILLKLFNTKIIIICKNTISLVIHLPKKLILLLIEAIKKLWYCFCITTLGKQYEIQKDISKIIRKKQNENSITEEDKHKEILKNIDEYYKDDKSISITLCFKRLEYLNYNKNMLNGITSGFIASIVFLLLQQYVKYFSPFTTKILEQTNNIVFKILTYIILIILIVFFIVFPSILFIRSIIIYCFRILYNGQKSFYNSYESKVIKQTLNRRLQIKK